MNVRKLKVLLDIVIFILTVFLVLYGLQKGFNLIELSTNLVYFAALLSKLIVDFIYDAT